MTSYIVLFLLLFLQFVIAPFGVSHFEIPKVILTELGIILLIFIKRKYTEKKLIERKSLLQKKSNISFLHKQYPYLLLLIAFLVFTILHLFTRSSPISFFGNPFRMQGIFLFWLVLFFSFISSLVVLPSSIRRYALIALTLQFLATILMQVTVDNRAVGTLGEPNALAAATIFLWPWIVVGIRENKGEKGNKGIIIIGMLLTFLIILFSGSRSGFLAFGLQVVFLILSRFISLKKTVLICMSLIFIMVCIPLFDKDTVYENRGEIWKTALIAGYEHPITGWGVGNTEIALKVYNKKLYNRLQGYYVDSSHNFLLDWWVQGGIVGVGLIAVLLMDVLRKFIQERNTLCLALFVGLITVMLFNPVSVVTSIHFWWLMGQTVKE